MKKKKEKKGNTCFTQGSISRSFAFSHCFIEAFEKKAFRKVASHLKSTF